MDKLSQDIISRAAREAANEAARQLGKRGAEWVEDSLSQDNHQAVGAKTQRTNSAGPAVGKERPTRVKEEGSEGGGYVKYFYEVGPKRDLMGPVVRNLYDRVDVQKVSTNFAGASAGSGVGQIVFEPQGWQSAVADSIRVHDNNVDPVSVPVVVYPLHAHPIGIYGDHLSHDSNPRWPFLWSKHEKDVYEDVAPGRWAVTRYGLNHSWFELAAYDAEKYSNKTSLAIKSGLEGWSSHWKGYAYDNGPLVAYADQSGTDTAHDDVKPLNAAIKSKSEYLVHTSSTILLRLYGLARSQARYTVKLCRCKPQYMPGRNPRPSDLTSASYDGGKRVKVENAVTDSMSVGMTPLALWHNQVHQYVSTAGRQNVSASLFDTPDPNGVDSVWEEEFVIEPRSDEYSTGANKCVVRLHVGQERLKRFSHADEFDTAHNRFEPPTASSVETGNSSADASVADNGQVIDQFSRADRVTRTVYASPREQLFVVVMAHQRVNDSSSSKAHDGSGSIVSNTGIRNVQHSYDIDVYDRFMVPGRTGIRDN